LRGKGSNQVKITSQPYDVAANTIDLALGGKQLKPTNITAVGNVRLVSRNEVTGQKVIATCDKSIYKGGTGAGDRGTIQMVGNFRAETYDKGFTGPVVLQGDSGTFQFLPTEILPSAPNRQTVLVP
jgi:lipopolysaccharide export system protein LptA